MTGQGPLASLASAWRTVGVICRRERRSLPFPAFADGKGEERTDHSGVRREVTDTCGRRRRRWGAVKAEAGRGWEA